MRSGKIEIVLLTMLMFPTVETFSQNNVLADIIQEFTQYVSSVPREEIYIHTDREEYIAGEEVFFALYILDRQTFKVSEKSKIAYVELRNEQNIPVIQLMISAADGTGFSNFTIPDTLQSGIYTIIAYTSWMKNFLPQNCFIKDLMVYNVLSDEQGLTTRRRLPSGVQNIKPEKVNDIILDRSVKDTLKFRFRNQLPTINRSFFTLIHTRGNIDYTGTHFPRGESTVISIPANRLAPGVNHLAIFNESGNMLGDLLFYTPFPNEKETVLETEETFKPGEKINLRLHVPSDGSEASRFSISVAPGESNHAGIRDYLIFGTEFGIQPGDFPAQVQGNTPYLTVIDSMLARASSNWINWTVIRSGILPGFQYSVESEYYYLSGRVIHTNRTVEDSLPRVLLCSPGKNAVFQFVDTDQDGEFRFPVYIDQRLSDFILMSEKEHNDSHIELESSFSGFLPEFVGEYHETLKHPEYIAKWSVNYQVRKIYGFSETDTVYRKNSILPEKKRFYGKPDHEIRLSEYITLPLMEEIFFEIVPNVAVRKQGSRSEIVIIDRISNRPYMAVPYLMIDGVIVSDPGLIIDMDPGHVEKIDVIRENFFVGDYIFPGIVNVITKKAQFTEIEMPGYMTRVRNQFKLNQERFNLDDYLEKGDDNRLPDYRTTLYWDPQLITEETGVKEITFFTSDNKSDYNISIQGVSGSGEVFSAEGKIRVE